MTKIEMVKEEHAATCGGEYPIKVVARGESRYHCYWNDGEIQRRDTYIVDKHGAVLEDTYQRYDRSNKWLKLG